MERVIFKSIRNVTYHLNGAKGADHRGPEVDPWARATLPAQDRWGTRQWQMMQKKKAEQQQAKIKRYSGVLDEEKLKATPLGALSVAPSEAPQPAAQPPSSGNADEWLAGDPNTMAASQGGSQRAVARFRLRYSKLDMARFLGAKEVATLFARSCRRASLPIAYSQGFHPLPPDEFWPGSPGRHGE